MTEPDFESKLHELDHLLNDPDVPMEPRRVWSLLAEVASHDALALAPRPNEERLGGRPNERVATSRP